MIKNLHMQEIIAAFSTPRLWALLAWFDIGQRYRRSVLGPLWLTLSTGIVVGTLGILWSRLFGVDVKVYLPFFASGYVVWTFISQQLNESCFSFVQFEAIIKQSRLPFAVFVLRILLRNFIIFLHNSVIVILVILFCDIEWTWQTMVAFLGLAVLSVTLFGISSLLAVLCTRFRDIAPIVQNLTAIAFYLTPIMWRPDALGTEHHWVIEFNPLAQLINIIREPILGGTCSLYTWSTALSFMFFCLLCGCTALAAYRNRIAYWL